MGEVTRRVLQRLSVDGGRELVMEEVTYPPGAAASPHRHPVGGLLFIVEGEAESAYEGDPPRRYAAGASLQDHAELPHVLFRNASADRPLRFVASYLIAPGTPYVEPL